MNITLWKYRQLNLEDAAQKHAQARPVPSMRLLANVDADFTEASARAPKRLQVEQGLLRQIPNMGASRTGALIEKERNTISMRSED
jgi:hypothetical protein